MGKNKDVVKGLLTGKMDGKVEGKMEGKTRGLLLCLASGLASILLYPTSEAKASGALPDACLQNHSKPSTQQIPRVVVVGMDEATRHPKPFGLGQDLKAYRAYNATLIQQLNQAGVAAIGFDFYYAKIPGLEQQTAEFVQAAQQSKAPVVIGINGGLIPGYTELKLEDNDPVFLHEDIGQGTLVLYQNKTKLNPLDSQGEAITTAAHELAILEGIWGLNSLVHEMALRTGTVDSYQLYENGFIQQDTSGLIQLKGSANLGRAWPQIAQIPPQSICTLSYLDVYSGRHQDVLEGAFVLVGMMADGLDRFKQPDPAAPDLQNVYGVFLHAAALSQILTEAYAPSESIANLNSRERPKTQWWLEPVMTTAVEVSHPGDKTLERLVISAFIEATEFMAVIDNLGGNNILEILNFSQRLVQSAEALTQILEDLEQQILKHITKTTDPQSIDSQKLYNQLALLEHRISVSQKQSSHPLSALDARTRDPLKNAIFNVGRHLEGVVNVAYFLALDGPR